jgi:hypothetical protein
MKRSKSKNKTVRIKFLSFRNAVHFCSKLSPGAGKIFAGGFKAGIEFIELPCHGSDHQVLHLSSGLPAIIPHLYLKPKGSTVSKAEENTAFQCYPVIDPDIPRKVQP